MDMGNQPNSREPRLRSFHCALVAEGLVGTEFTMKMWERLVVHSLGTMTRQSVQDATFAMDALALISRPRRGFVRILSVPDELLASNDPSLVPVEIAA
jgi:hypothetical protein